jgi:surface protein
MRKILSGRTSSLSSNGEFRIRISGSNQFAFTIPILSATPTGGGTFSFSVNWGDGSAPVTINSSNYNDFGVATHTYGGSGTRSYSIVMKGAVRGVKFTVNPFNNATKLDEITNWGDFRFTETDTFAGCGNLNEITATDIPQFEQTDMEDTFAGCAKLKKITNIANWDVSGVTNMRRFFGGCSALSEGGGGLGTNADISGWDVSTCQDFGRMFLDCNAWNGKMFKVITGGSAIGSVNFERCFQNCFIFNNDGSNNMSAWSMDKATDTSFMFNRAENFNQDISSWDVSNVSTMEDMFRDANTFNQPIGNWDVSSVTNMRYMFRDANIFNQPIGNWNTSSVTDMTGMFYEAPLFDQDISTKSVTVGGVTYTAWDVSNVVNMGAMFAIAGSFNQDISSWDVSSVNTGMGNMFVLATSFNQDLGAWDVSNVTNMSRMFENSGLSTTNYSNTLIGWAALVSLQSGVLLGAGTIQYSAATATTARNTLTSAPNNWGITDGGAI